MQNEENPDDSGQQRPPNPFTLLLRQRLLNPQNVNAQTPQQSFPVDCANPSQPVSVFPGQPPNLPFTRLSERYQQQEQGLQSPGHQFQQAVGHQHHQSAPQYHQPGPSAQVQPEAASGSGSQQTTEHSYPQQAESSSSTSQNNSWAWLENLSELQLLAIIQANMASNQAGRGGPPPQTDPVSGAQLNQIVIEYLNKKGYIKTEAMLRLESANTDAEGRPIISRVEDDPEGMYDKSYTLLKDWIDSSLGLYQPQLRKLLFPIFVHSFLELVNKGFVDGGKRFFAAHKGDHELQHGHDLTGLSAIALPPHVEHNELARLFRSNKYRVILSKVTYNLLTNFLNDNEAAGGSVIIRLINTHIQIIESQEKPTLYSAGNEYEVGDGEGIRGHAAGRADQPGSLPRVRLGPIRLDPELKADVEERLRELDAQAKDREMDLGVATGPSHLDEFQARIKREESEDAIMRDEIPLPPYKGADIDREVQAVRDSLQRFKLEGTPTPPLPSICTYTFHHTNNNLHCVSFTSDGRLAAAGFAESYVRIWDLTNRPLESIIPGNNPTQPSSSRKLIAHSGPIYSTSFSPCAKYLLSSSEDKTIRLWSLDLLTPLVVFKGHTRPVWDVAFSPYGQYFASGGGENTARVWSIEHIYPLRLLAGHTQDVSVVGWHPNSAYVFTGSDDKTARMWDITRGASVRLFSGHTAPITAMAASPNGRLLATAAEDHNILLWDLAAGKRLKTMRGHGKTSIYSLSFSAESSVLVSCGADNSIRVWNVGAGSGNPVVEGSIDGNVVTDAGVSGPPKIEGGVGIGGGKPGKKGKDVVAT